MENCYTSGLVFGVKGVTSDWLGYALSLYSNKTLKNIKALHETKAETSE